VTNLCSDKTAASIEKFLPKLNAFLTNLEKKLLDARAAALAAAIYGFPVYDYNVALEIVADAKGLLERPELDLLEALSLALEGEGSPSIDGRIIRLGAEGEGEISEGDLIRGQ